MTILSHDNSNIVGDDFPCGPGRKDKDRDRVKNRQKDKDIYKDKDIKKKYKDEYQHRK